ncbi:MAG: ABC transporter ATP-binding protein [Bdellovibrionota bacterium]
MSKPSELVVEVKHVSKTYDSVPAVTDASFTIKRGECFGLLGPNGAGKSTLIRMMYGASSRTSGEMQVLGLDPQKNGRDLRRKIGIVTQEDALDEAMSVVENMQMFARFLGIPKDVAKSRIDELLAFMSLTHKSNTKIQELSGGMRRRLVFVRALLSDPELLILDEPTTGLDPAVRQLIWDKVEAFKRRGRTVLLTTHYMDEAEFLCDRLVIVDNGTIKLHGAPRALINEHCPGFVAIWSKSQIQAGDGDDVASAPNRRLERATLSELAEDLKREPTQPEIIRPTSLEDVFLKVTGRELGSNA